LTRTDPRGRCAGDGRAGWELGRDFAQAGAEPVVCLTRLAAAAATASEQLKNVLFGRRLPGAGCPYML